MSFNVYDDAERAEAYAGLEFPGTYYLAYRDLPEVFGRFITGRLALDFGCGTGRSTRFLKRLGFEAIGVDISSSMIVQAKKFDPAGIYLLVEEGDFTALEPKSFDLVLSAFAFDNIPDVEKRAALLTRLRSLLSEEGRIVILGSTPDIYLHEWASFTTEAFPENARAASGKPVRIVMKDVADSRPVTDLLWHHEDYLQLFATSKLDLVARLNPLGQEAEPYEWISETSVAPWVIYVLKAA